MSEAGTVRGYHFFLVPPPEARETIRTCVEQLAAAYGGPVFEPHLTVLPEIELPEDDLKRIGAEAAKSGMPVLSFNDVRTGDEFFKCCYLSVDLNAELAALHTQLEADTGMKVSFDPHVSLAYGTYDADTLARMKADAATYFAEHPVMGGPAAALELWKTEGRTEDWQRVISFS